MLGVAGIDLALSGLLRHLVAIGDAHGARQAIELEEHRSRAIVMNITHRDEANDQSLATLEIQADLLSRLEPVEKDSAGQSAHIAETQSVRRVLHKHLWIHEVRGQLCVCNRTSAVSGRLDALAFPVSGAKDLARAHLQRFRVLEDLALQRVREAAIWLAEVAAEELDNRLRKRDLLRWIEHRRAREPCGHHHQREIADHLRSGRDLDDVAEHL